MSKLLRDNYLGNTVSIAKDLLGKYLVRMWHGQPLVCRIVETEAYVGAIDKAAHAYRYHKTPRNATMFGPPYCCEVWSRYGARSRCTCCGLGSPLRSLQPISGRISSMGRASAARLWGLHGRIMGWTSPGMSCFCVMHWRI